MKLEDLFYLWQKTAQESTGQRLQASPLNVVAFLDSIGALKPEDEIEALRGSATRVDQEDDGGYDRG